MKTEELKELFEKMTLSEKLGQLTQTTAEHFIKNEGDEADDDIEKELVETGPAFDELEEQKEALFTVGSVLGVSGAKVINRIQKNFLEQNRLKIPLLFMHDAIHGYRTVFPIPLAMAGSFDEETVKLAAKCTAKELRAVGIHVNFSPMNDLVRDARWGRVMESFGEDAVVSGRLGKAMIQGYQGSTDGTIGRNGVASCLKHFAAYGAAEGGRDYAAVDLSWKEFFGAYAKPYEIALEGKPRFVMSSFNSLNGEPATASRFLLTDVLRGRYGFDGIVISDWGAVAELKNHGVASDDRDAAKLALNAGVEIEMTSSSYLRFGKELAEKNRGLEKKINEAVWKVLCLKNALGLFENPYANEAEEEKVLLSQELLDAAKRAACESCVLLKNEKLLPIKKDCRTMILTGPYAKTKELLGNWSCRGSFDDTVSLEEGMKAVFPNARVEAYENFSECPKELLETADFVLVTLGEAWELSGEGHSSANLELPVKQQELIEAVRASGRDFAAVVFSGRPLALGSVDEKIPALMWCWYPGTCTGMAVAELLAGECSPSGKLAMSLPRVSGQAPLYYNEYRSGRPANESSYSSRYQDCGIGALYPFGHGLSYAKIIYSDAAVSSGTIRGGETVTFSVKVTNSSEYSVKETVLLYMNDPVSALVRPVKELLDFKRVSLKPHQSAEVIFEVSSEALKYLNNELKRVIEPGIVNLFLNSEEKPAAQIQYE